MALETKVECILGEFSISFGAIFSFMLHVTDAWNINIKEILAMNDQTETKQPQNVMTSAPSHNKSTLLLLNREKKD